MRKRNQRRRQVRAGRAISTFVQSTYEGRRLRAGELPRSATNATWDRMVTLANMARSANCKGRASATLARSWLGSGT